MNESVYKNSESRNAMMGLYDAQLTALNIEYEDLHVDTRFGKTHLLKTGNPSGIPIVLFHGGNSTSPFHLRDFLFLKQDYLIYAPDTIGHPGKSSETILSPNNLEYGEWASDLISALELESSICIGSSYGGGILMKLMCVAPGKISKAVLIVPSGISNVSVIQVILKLGIPMLLYRLRKNKKSLLNSILPMAVHSEEIDQDTLDMVRMTFDHVNVKAGMPSNVSKDDLREYLAPTLLMAAEKDVLFPGIRVIQRGKEIIRNVKTFLLTGSGHMSRLGSERHLEVRTMILDFIESKDA